MRIVLFLIFRCYRGVFVWCDVVDDDFIFLFSESGEYVLKVFEVVEFLRGICLKYELFRMILIILFYGGD